jgi:hypothetical protein
VINWGRICHFPVSSRAAGKIFRPLSKRRGLHHIAVMRIQAVTEEFARSGGMNTPGVAA